jgi:hypothetical protein
MSRLKRNFAFLAAAVLFSALLACGLAACKSGSNGAGTLSIVKDGQTKSLRMADLKKLTVVSGSTGDVTSSGTIEGPSNFKGTALNEILKSVGGITASNAVRISAKDGYSMTMSYKQVTEGVEFPTYDKTTGKETTPSGPVTVFVAYEKDGKPIDDTVGPLRLGIMAPGQVTDGHWWVKWTQKIEVISVQAPWTMSLQGQNIQSIDKSTFESCAAPKCHGASWTDAQGHAWVGVPLWYLVGNVDHKDNTLMTFDDALADKGYEVHLANSNGDMVTFTSAQVKRNNDLIVANQVDGKPLSTTQWPLALVGKAVDQQHQIGMIAKLKVVLP